jgi:hypothetical protein
MNGSLNQRRAPSGGYPLGRAGCPPGRRAVSAWKRQVLALLLFGTAFGYLEAAVVSYLRYLHEPVRRQFYPSRPASDLFPLLTPEQAAIAEPLQRKVRLTEIGREAATIVMLGAVALTMSANGGQWAAAFVIAFGAWDSTFYLFLKILLDWPASLVTWDILFIIPVPWVAPVIAPVLVSAAMMLAGSWHLQRECTARPVLLRARNWALLAAGAAVIVLSFTLDSANVASGGMPRPFHWEVFGTGLTIGVLAYAEAAWRRESRHLGAMAQ